MADATPHDACCGGHSHKTDGGEDQTTPELPTRQVNPERRLREEIKSLRGALRLSNDRAAMWEARFKMEREHSAKLESQLQSFFGGAAGHESGGGASEASGVEGAQGGDPPEGTSPDVPNAKRSVGSDEHELLTVPNYCGKWRDGAFKKVKTKHAQQLCICKKRTRTYCKCNVRQFLCSACFVDHRIKEMTGATPVEIASEDHDLLSMPLYAGRWRDGAFTQIKTMRAQYHCKWCKKKTRKYCKCSPEMSLCTTCFADHKGARITEK